MPLLKLNLDAIMVESFDTAPRASAGEQVRPRTFEPGCTADFCRVDPAV